MPATRSSKRSTRPCAVVPARFPKSARRSPPSGKSASWRQSRTIPSGQIDLGTGTISCVLQFPEELFYSVLSEQSGFDVKNDGDLIGLLEQLSSVKREYDKVANALDEVRATG